MYLPSIPVQVRYVLYLSQLLYKFSSTNKELNLQALGIRTYSAEGKRRSTRNLALFTRYDLLFKDMFESKQEKYCLLVHLILEIVRSLKNIPEATNYLT